MHPLGAADDNQPAAILLLDRTAQSQAASAETSRPDEPAARPRNRFTSIPGRVARVYRDHGARGLISHVWHFFLSQSFSSLTRRIVFLNVAGLFALLVGIFYLSQFRAGLIDARVQSLVVQGEIIASAIAASAT